MAWLYLVLAGICEIGWPLGLKLGWTDQGARPWWIVFAVVAMTASGALLLWAQRFIPMGTAYCGMDWHRRGRRIRRRHPGVRGFRVPAAHGVDRPDRGRHHRSQAGVRKEHVPCA